jgi:hypothetical protein
MDLDFDSLIYIIITIVFLALGALGKKKKPVQSNPVFEEMDVPDAYDVKDDPIPDPLKEFFGAYMNQPVPEPEVRNVEPASEILDTYTPVESKLDTYIPSESVLDTYTPAESTLDIPVSGIDSIQSYLDKQVHQEGVPVFEHYVYEDVIKQSEIGDVHEKTLRNPVISEIIKDFEVRKAVIYAEILKPKYL